MQKIIVRFIPEGMSIVPLLKLMTKKDVGIKKVVREYLRKMELNINYVEFLLIKSLYIDVFEDYTFTFYKYGDEFNLQYSNMDVINNLSQYIQIFNFHPDLNASTKHWFIGHSEGTRIIFEIIQKQLELSGTKILNSFLQYARENKPELSFFRFLSTLFLISITDGCTEISIKDRIIQLTILPNQRFRPGPARAQKIEIDSLNLASIIRVTEIICTNKIQGLYFITGCKYKSRRTIEIIKTILIHNFIEVSDYRILGPDQHVDFNLNRRNLFIVFEDVKNFFDKISYQNHFGVFIKKI